MTLRPMRSTEIGDAVARKMFAQRGNHSEIHLSEEELAALLTAAAVVARQSPEPKELRDGKEGN